MLCCRRLAQVGAELDAIGADAAEGTVRKILTGLGFTDEMQVRYGAEGPLCLCLYTCVLYTCVCACVCICVCLCVVRVCMCVRACV